MIHLKSLHHVRFSVPDVEASLRFCLDFGLLVASREADRIHMRGAGPNAYCFIAERGPKTEMLAMAFAVETEHDLHRAVAEHGASAIRQIDGPGGGLAATLRDPDGIPIDLIWGVAEVEPIPLRADIRPNTPGDISRRGARQQLPERAPPQIIRIGHLGIFVSDYDRSAAWYGDVLGFRLSDGVVMGPNRMSVVGFFRLDRGAEWVDHHSLALFRGGPPGAQHLSFEVQDFEAQLLSHEYLTQKGWSPLWGVGRHELGSHIFDVWWEPNDIRFETFSDTDVYNHEKPPEMFEARPTLTRWGPDMPMAYLHPRGVTGIVGKSD